MGSSHKGSTGRACEYGCFDFNKCFIYSIQSRILCNNWLLDSFNMLFSYPDRRMQNAECSRHLAKWSDLDPKHSKFDKVLNPDMSRPVQWLFRSLVQLLSRPGQAWLGPGQWLSRSPGPAPKIIESHPSTGRCFGLCGRHGCRCGLCSGLLACQE